MQRQRPSLQQISLVKTYEIKSGGKCRKPEKKHRNECESDSTESEKKCPVKPDKKHRNKWDDSSDSDKRCPMKSNKKHHNRCDSSTESSHDDKCKCEVNDKVALRVEAIWKDAFPNASLLPVIGLPSNSGGVATLTHTIDNTLMSINGLPSKSPLANNALYSFECSNGVYLNLYEIMLPDIPGKHGSKSTVEYYTHLLEKQGLSVAGNHWHFLGQFLIPEATLVSAIHHQSTKNEITPEEFSKRTIYALKKTIKLIEKRSQHHRDD
jgi:hypothetical protein